MADHCYGHLLGLPMCLRPKNVFKDVFNAYEKRFGLLCWSPDWDADAFELHNLHFYDDEIILSGLNIGQGQNPSRMRVFTKFRFMNVTV